MMPKYRVTGPDGAAYEIEAPEGATEADVMGYVQTNVASQPMGNNETRPQHGFAEEMGNAFTLGAGGHAAAPEGASDADVMGFVQSQTEALQPAQPQIQQVNLPQERNPISAGEGIARAALQGVTFGGGDELAAGLKAAVNPSNFNEVYDQTLNRARSRADQFREESPVTSTVAEIGGALPTALLPMGALGRAAQGGSLATRAGAGAAIGAGQGAVYGFNAGEGLEDRLGDATTGALVGGALGAAAPAIGAGVQRVANLVPKSQATRATIAAAPSVDDLAARSHALFEQADNLGVMVKPDAYQSFASDLADTVAREGIDAQVTPASSGAFARVMQEAQSGAPLSLQSLNTVRRVAQNAAGSVDPNERRIASIMIDKMDDFIDNLTPAALESGDAGVAGPILKEARSLWGKLRRTQMVDGAVSRAERRAASTGSGGNVNNAIRQNLRSILDSPAKSRGFSPTELKAMEDVVRGTPSQNALRLAGKLSPQGNGLSLILNLGAAGASGGATIPLTAAGMGAKMLADKGTQNSTRLARALVAQGGNAIQPQLGTQSGRLAQLLAQRNAALTGPAR